jgi:hypothetical protein
MNKSHLQSNILTLTFHIDFIHISQMKSRVMSAAIQSFKFTLRLILITNCNFTLHPAVMECHKYLKTKLFHLN